MKRFLVLGGFFLIMGAGCAHMNSTKSTDDDAAKPEAMETNAQTKEEPTCGVENKPKCGQGGGPIGPIEPSREVPD